MADAAGINLKLQKWRQGDVILGLDLPFLHVFDAQSPITDLSRQEVGDEPPKAMAVDFRSVGDTVAGFVVITQTCDIVRECDKRPYIELAPLAEVDEDTYNHIKADLVPRFAYLRPLEAQKLVADLDRVMTVEKSVLARVSDHARLLGCETDEEQSRFVRALVRKRSRFAFPDSFVKAMSAIQDRVRKRHDKDTDEGDFLRAIWQIRVRADPSWNDPVPELTIYVLFREDQQILDRYERAARQLLDRFDTSTGLRCLSLFLFPWRS